MMKIPVFYRPEQTAQGHDSYSPSAGKPALVAADWMSNPEIAPHVIFEHFSAASIEDLCVAHDPRYVRDVLTGKTRNGFGDFNKKVAASLPYTVGSMVAACKHVLSPGMYSNHRVAVSPTSGFHHAGFSTGGGFCTFNGLMVAAITVHDLGLADRILIVDMDAHYGDGTDDIINRLGIDYVDNVTATKSYSGADEALRVANLRDRLGNDSFKDRQYDLVIYQAGADIHVDDCGSMTTEQMRERDMLVFLSCVKSRTPVVWNLAGGYQRSPEGDIEPVLALHRQTMLMCRTIFNPDTSGTELD